MEYTGERIVLEAKECSPETLLFKEHAERYKFAAKFVQGKRVLDIACGVGYGSEILYRLGKPQSIVGGDISDEAIQYATSRYKDLKNVRFQKLNAESLALENKSIDVTVSFETIEHLEHVERYLQEVDRVLAKDGVYIVSTPNKDVTHSETNVVDNPFHYHEFVLEEIEALLKSKFPTVAIYYQREYKPTAITSALSSVSKWKSLYRRVIPRIIRVDLRNYLFPDISNDVRIYPTHPGVSPLYFVFVCKK